MQISAGEFKAKCLKLMDDVKNTHEVVVITKFGKPVAKLVPVDDDRPRSPFGYLTGAVNVQGDITGPVGESWDAE